MPVYIHPPDTKSKQVEDAIQKQWDDVMALRARYEAKVKAGTVRTLAEDELLDRIIRKAEKKGIGRRGEPKRKRIGKKRRPNISDFLDRKAMEMRSAPTPAEDLLRERLDLLRRENPPVCFTFQLPICGRYIADFACKQAHVIVEADGGVHDSEAARKHDAERDQAILRSGFIVLRFWNRTIFESTDRVVEEIRHACLGRMAHGRSA